MSSVTSFFDQRSARTTFFLVVGTPVDGDGDNVDNSAFTFNTSTPVIPKTVVGSSVFEGYDVTYYDLTSTPGLLKDLGRQIVVCNDDASLKSPVVAIFRECAVMDNADAEGINTVTNVFVKTFSADGAGVVVARTG